MTLGVSDARWELIEPVLSAWRAERWRHRLDIGRPPEHELREIMNAILYVGRTGVQWRYLPRPVPRSPHPAVETQQPQQSRPHHGLTPL